MHRFTFRSLSIIILMAAMLLSEVPLQAQPAPNQVNQGRLRGVVITESLLATAGTIALHYLW